MTLHQAQSNALPPKKRALPLRILDRVYGAPIARPNPTKRIHAERVRAALTRGWIVGWATLLAVLFEIQRDPPQGVIRPLALIFHPAPSPAQPESAPQPGGSSKPSARLRPQRTKPVNFINILVLVFLAAYLLSTWLPYARYATINQPGLSNGPQHIGRAFDGNPAPTADHPTPIASSSSPSSVGSSAQGNHLSRTDTPALTPSSIPTDPTRAPASQPSLGAGTPKPSANALAQTTPTSSEVPSIEASPTATTTPVLEVSGNPTIAIPPLPTSDGGENGGGSQPTNTPVPTAQPTNTPVPTNQPTNTPVPTAQPTDTPVPTAQPTDTPVPTAQPTPCPDPQQPINVILLIDRSNSMSGQKITSAKQAATMFVKLLDLGVHQIGIVTFAREAKLDSVLTHDTNALEAKLKTITTASGTNIAAGLRLATEQLNSDSHTDARKVIILLSDGHASVQASQTMPEADAAKEAQVELFTIALGNNADEQTLGKIASAPDHFYTAPNPALLDDIYADIAQALVGCRANQTAAPTATPAVSPTATPAADTAGKPPVLTDANADPPGEVVPCLADTYVSSAQPEQAYAHDNLLKIRARSPEQWTLIHCQGSGQVVDDVKLRLFVVEGAGDGQIRSVLDPWDDRATWRTRPRLGDPIGEFDAVAARHWIEIDVTSALQDDGSIAVAIQASGTGDIALASLEHSALGPQLVVIH